MHWQPRSILSALFLSVFFGTKRHLDGARVVTVLLKHGGDLAGVSGLLLRVGARIVHEAVDGCVHVKVVLGQAEDGRGNAAARHARDLLHLGLLIAF